MSHGTSSNPAKNLHPVKRYEVVATSDAPGPWDSIEGYIGYDIVNTGCIPLAPFLGERSLTSIGLTIEMTRVDDHTWKGHFYRDAFQDEDYAGHGVCHWDADSIGVSATFQGVRFNWSTWLDALKHESFGTAYFRKSVYGDRSFASSGAPALTAEDPEVREHPAEYFRSTVAVREDAP